MASHGIDPAAALATLHRLSDGIDAEDWDDTASRWLEANSAAMAKIGQAS